MKIIHNTAKIIIVLVEIGVIALILLSVLPILAGGVSVEMDDPASAVSGDYSKITIDGQALVESNMPWDIGLEYSVYLGTEDDPVASSDAVSKQIVSGQRTELPFNIEVSLISAMLYAVDSGLQDDGQVGDMTLPLIFKVHGDYIDKLLKFDVKVDVSEAIQNVSGNVSSVNGDLQGSIGFTPIDILPDMNTGPIGFSIGSGVTGSFAVVIDENGGTFSFNMDSSSGDLMADVESARNPDRSLTLDFGGQPYTMSPETAQTFIDTLNDMMNKVIP